MINFPSGPIVGQEFAVGNVIYVWNGQGWIVKGGGAPIPAENLFMAPQGRLTLVTGQAVMTSSIVDKTDLFYTGYAGNLAPFMRDGDFTMRECPEIVASTFDTSRNPYAIQPGKLNDWFLWEDPNANDAIVLSHGFNWESNVSRGTGAEITRLPGLWVNEQPITNGPAAGKGTYIGTTGSDGAAKLHHRFGGPDVPGVFYVWNAYNRVQVVSNAYLSAISWPYQTAAWRGSNGVNQVAHYMLSGLKEDGIVGNFTQFVQLNAGSCHIGIGVDSFNSPATIAASTVSPGAQSIMVTGASSPVLGAHFISALETGDGTNVATFYGAPRQAFTMIWRA